MTNRLGKSLNYAIIITGNYQLIRKSLCNFASSLLTDTDCRWELVTYKKILGFRVLRSKYNTYSKKVQ